MYFKHFPSIHYNCLKYMLQLRLQIQLRRQYVNNAAVPPPLDRIAESLLRSTQNKSPLHGSVYGVHRTYSFDRGTGDLADQLILTELDELDNREAKNINGTPNFHQLCSAQSINEMLSLMRSQHTLDTKQYVQVMSILWIYYQRLPITAKSPLTEQLQTQFLPHLLTQIQIMDISDLSSCYLYLRKMHVPNSNSTLEAILTRALQLIELNVGRELIPLHALSRLLVAINLERDFFTPLVCQHFKPHLEQHIADCQTEQQVRLLSTCLFQLHALIDKDLLKAYKQRVMQLLESNILSSHTPKALLKLLHMLNLPIWSSQNTTLIRKLMLELCKCLGPQQQLEPNDLKSVCRTFLHHQEPAEIIQPLKEATEALLQQELSADALSCAVPFVDFLQRDVYICQFRQLLYSKAAWELPNASSHFFSVLRALKIADVGDCDAYWSAVIRKLKASPQEQMHLRFLRHCQRYMNFNNNLGGTYRHLEFERILSRLCLNAIENSVAGRLPSKFAHLAAFIMAYGHTPFAWKKFPNTLLSKILAMTSQFSIQDCFLMSRGIQIACELRFRQHVPPILAMQLTTIDTILISCSERHLSTSGESQPLNASDLSIIVRTLSHRKSLKNSQVYQLALARYNMLNSADLNSRVVRDMAYNFNASNFFDPELLEAMFNYITQQHDHITGDTVEKVLTCAYNLGYTPASLESLKYAAEIILRDFDHMSGLSVVQSCLALCFYKCIPEQLINQVFCIKFIQRVEDEIQICYSKATYPGLVLNRVMQLNRTVCLDLPEANVPWFQQNYIEAQLSKKSITPSEFSTDIKNYLQRLLENEKYFRCNHTTPYGYNIDFVIHFDKNKKPIPASPIEATMLDRITKVAILLLKLDSFCENDLSALRGPESLKMKHLEMMGYKVLQINEHDWNSKYMAVPGAKTNYLKCLLQIST